MASRRTLAIAGLALLASVATSGCLAEEFLPEPWTWRDVDRVGDEFASPDYSETVTVPLEERTNRVRVQVDVTLENDPPDPLASTLQDGPGLRLNVTVPAGDSYTYFFESTRSFRDLYPDSGDDAVEIQVTARGQGSWSLDLDAYEPQYEDYRWYAFWDR